jgi:hypothetical protein
MTCAEIDELVREFENTSLAKERWTHAAHVTVALHYVRTHGAAAATVRMRNAIQRFNAAMGRAPTAYHETITLAWIAVVSQFLARADVGQPLAQLVETCLQQTGDKSYLQRHYTREVLMSDDARTRWLPPDLLPFGDVVVAEPESIVCGSRGSGGCPP